MRVAFTTLGCKINQFETDALQQEFLSQGSTLVSFDSEADVYVINTCTVTAKSDYRCRQIIRSAVRRGKGAKVVVTGCYAETHPEEIKRIPGVELVFGNRAKNDIPAHILSLVSTSVQNRLPVANDPGMALQTKTRGFLKIQDGCDNHCSYCIVPLARGASRSVAPADVREKFAHLVNTGCREVVLTGIHIGAYESDEGKRFSLTDMLKALIESRGGARIRLSSIEPLEVTAEMISFLGQGLCRHLHVPLQSGDDSILASMKRNYTSAFYRELLENITKQVPGTALGADVMVGFPGEGENEFQNTMRLVEQSPLSHLHVFSYSRRPGTPAAGMRNQIQESIKRERSEALRSLGIRKNLLFRKLHLGTEHSVIVEDKINPATGLLAGLTDNYMRVHIEGAKTAHIGKEVRVCIKSVNEEATFGELL